LEKKIKNLYNDPRRLTHGPNRPHTLARPGGRLYEAFEGHLLARREPGELHPVFDETYYRTHLEDFVGRLMGPIQR